MAGSAKDPVPVLKEVGGSLNGTFQQVRFTPSTWPNKGYKGGNTVCKVERGLRRVDVRWQWCERIKSTIALSKEYGRKASVPLW
jgi:hypothetical protein